MIYFIGDKPSKKNTDKNVAFVGTRSYKTLLDWIYRMNLSINSICLFNHARFIETNNDRTWSSFDVVIALGNEASNALTKENIKKNVDKFLKECKDYIGVHNAS